MEIPTKATEKENEDFELRFEVEIEKLTDEFEEELNSLGDILK